MWDSGMVRIYDVLETFDSRITWARIVVFCYLPRILAGNMKMAPIS